LKTAMWFRLLHSMIISCLLMGPATAVAQSPFCDNKASVDSAISSISQRFSYLSEDWQHACDSLLNICPDLDRVWQMKAMPAVKTGDWHACFSNLDHAIAFNTVRWLPYQAFLKCIFTKDYAGALADFNRSDTLVPGAGVMDHSFDFYRGLCGLGLKDYKTAFYYLQKDIERQEQHRGKDNVHYNSLYYWGLYHYLTGAHDKAEAVFRQCLKTYPQYPEPSYYLGMTLRAAGRKEEALGCFQKAKESLQAGYHSNEDSEFYVNYPYAIALREVEEQIARP